MGLSVGLIIFIVSLAGAVLVFQDEIKDYTRHDVIMMTDYQIPEKGKVLPVSEMMKRVKEQVGESDPLSWLTIPLNKKQAYQFHYYDRDNSAWNYSDEFKVYKTAYVNPYNGKIIKVYNEKNDFFFIILRLHRSLLLSSEIGSWVIGISVIIFIFMLITGIIIWYPRNKSARKTRFWFRWKKVKHWRGRNYDLHNILGFYSSFFALIIAISGLYFVFKIIPKAYHYIGSGGQTEFFDPKKDLVIEESSNKLSKPEVLDKIVYKVEELYPKAYSYRLIIVPRKKKDKALRFSTVRVNQDQYNRKTRAQAYFNKQNGDLLLNRPYDSLNGGEKLALANYDIHTGAIYGVGTKILALIVSLICASLPVTGFLVWWNRRKKKKY